MPSDLDRYLPKTGLQFPDGAVLTIGTVSCDDQIHQAVYLAYTRADSPTPTLELELPPRSVETIILQLQEYANQARFINGERMVEYPEPHPAPRPRASRKMGRSGRRKAKPDQRDSAAMAGDTPPPANSEGPEVPPPGS